MTIVNLKRTLDKFLRGWLPKDPVMPESRLRNARKPVAVLITITLFAASFSLFYAYSVLNRPTPMVMPEPLPTERPTPQPSTP